VIVVEIQTLGVERFVRAFNRCSQEVKDLSPAFEEVYDNFCEVEERNFDAEGSPDGFAALSPWYARWKAMAYPGRKIMQLTGRLKDSLTANYSTDAVKEIHPKTARFGTRVPYAHRHQMGTDDMPARKIVQLTEPIKREWALIIQRYIISLLKKVLKESM
jgi:phage gpG-like protein